MFSDDDHRWMQRALMLARFAATQGEVPVAAVVVRDGELLAESFNRSITCHDPTAHAEVQVLRQCGQVLENYRFPGCTLYVTLEPCSMCAGALVHARLERLIFATSDPRTGAVCSQQQLLDAPWHNHHVAWQGGLLAEESGQLLTDFFRARRRNLQRQ